MQNMNDRTLSGFSSENGWAVGNINMAPTFPPPPYHSVQSEVPNFSNSIGPPQVPFPLNNFNQSSDCLKLNPEYGKFNAAFCPPYVNDVSSFDCVRMDDHLKLQNATSSYNHVPTVSHSLNFTSGPPVASCNMKNFVPFSSNNSLPVDQANSFQNLPCFQSHPSVPPQPNVSFVQRPVYDVPPPVVLRCPSTVESTSSGSFQQFSLPPLLQNFAPEPLQYHNHPTVPPPAYPRLPHPPVQPPSENPGSQKEQLLAAFLEKLQVTKKETTKSNLTVAEFRSALKMGLSLTKMLLNQKQNLTNLLHCDEDEWNAEINYVSELKSQITSVCSVISAPNSLIAMKKRLSNTRKKRALKSRLKQEATFCRLKKVQEREALHQEIDKWLDGIKEKNLKLKREAEMKKEADNILSEVRRKIIEVKRATEKLKVFEKLRATRQANAEQKGLFVAAEHGTKFAECMGALRGTLAAQLLDYEGEEHALRVMLEAEQEGQLEEEALWRLHKTKALQRKKQQAVQESLFGHTDAPSPADPLFLFYQHQNAGNCSIDTLVQIRHHWDVHLAENGDTIPQQWVVPFPSSSSTWELSLEGT